MSGRCPPSTVCYQPEWYASWRKNPNTAQNPILANLQIRLAPRNSGFLLLLCLPLYTRVIDSVIFKMGMYTFCAPKNCCGWETGSEEPIADYGILLRFDGWIMKPIDFKRLDVVLQGVKSPELKRDLLYSPRRWENGGWFLL